MAGRPPSDLQRTKFTTRLDPNVLRTLKEESVREFGTPRKVYVLIERWVRRDLLKQTEERNP